MLNDADAAGLAEMSYGAGAGVKGVVVLLTLGTGIGSALFLDGRLVPNTEFGHLEMRGMEGEHWAAASVRERQRLSWAKWSERLSEYIDALDRLIWPDLVILGGGVSRKAEKFVPRLEVRPAVVAAKLENRAGIIGAAMRASERA
jgi:polyphosphate glucokinase